MLTGFGAVANDSFKPVVIGANGLNTHTLNSIVRAKGVESVPILSYRLAALLAFLFIVTLVGLRSGCVPKSMSQAFSNEW